MPSADDLKKAVGVRAAALVESGMRVGLGTGSTAAHLVRALGARVADEGLDVVAVPTSEATAALSREVGIRLTTLDETPELDLTIDGADEMDPQMRLIKGGGGAHLREKIVACASKRMVVIADASKQVETLGAFPLPLEVVPFGVTATVAHLERAISQAGCNGALQRRVHDDGSAFVTDEGNAIFDAHLGTIPDVEALARELEAVPGLVEHGLFIGIATGALIAGEDGVEEVGEI